MTHASRLAALTPGLAQTLREHHLSSPHSSDSDFVFCTSPPRAAGPGTATMSAARLSFPRSRRRTRSAASSASRRSRERPFHGLRQTYASLRAAVGDDPAYTSEQIGHDDPRFTLRSAPMRGKRRQRLTGMHRDAFDRALEWAQRWAQARLPVPAVLSQVNAGKRNAA